VGADGDQAAGSVTVSVILACTAPDFLARLGKHGDPLAGLHEKPGRLPR
jgi:hypothetical protein